MSSSRLHALADLGRRYAAVWLAGWAVREQFDQPRKTDYELIFQPAHLELAETPIHPMPHWTARIIVALAFIALLVAFFARLDIVVTAKGELVPDARVKVIQPALTGVVREIAVRDGQAVAAGQLLMKLDTTQAAADENKAHATRIDAALAAARAQALLAAQQKRVLPQVSTVDDAAPERRREAQALADGIYQEYSDKLASARAELNKRQAELASAQHEIARLAATAPLARVQADDLKALASERYVSQSDYLDKEQAALDKEHELASLRSHSAELVAGIEEQRQDIEGIGSQFRREQLDALEKANEDLTQSRSDEAKAHTRQALLSLTAPVAGTVQQLAVHTLGGVVTTAQSLMELVPDDALEVNATIENKDVGFITPGQRVALKLEAFPYTRYGVLEGDVLFVSNDAVHDKKLGLAFTARIHLKSNKLHIANRWIELTPGMAVTAEIQTGTQSVAQYLLGPLIEGVQESMHER